MLTLVVVIALAAGENCTPELWCGNELPECVTPLARELHKAPASPKYVTRSEEVLRTETDETTRILAMRVLAKARKQSLEPYALQLAKEKHDCRFEGIELLASVPKWSGETRTFIEEGLETRWPVPFLRTISAREEPWTRAHFLNALRTGKKRHDALRALTSPPKNRELKEAVNFIGNCDVSLYARELAVKALGKLTKVKCPESKWRVKNGAVTDGVSTVPLISARQDPGVNITGETAEWRRGDGGVISGLGYLPLGVLQRGSETLVLGSRGGMFGAVGSLEENSISWTYDVPSLPTAWAVSGETVFVEVEADSLSSPAPVVRGQRVVHVFERDGGVTLAK